MKAIRRRLLPEMACTRCCARDKAKRAIARLKDDSLEDLDNLPAPELIAREIVEDRTAAFVESEAMKTVEGLAG